MDEATRRALAAQKNKQRTASVPPAPQPKIERAPEPIYVPPPVAVVEEVKVPEVVVPIPEPEKITVAKPGGLDGKS